MNKIVSLGSDSQNQFAFFRWLLLLCALFSGSVAKAADYYWVGGSGNWSDLSHWATTSGGSVQYATIPTANDRVIFDASSFTGANQVVTVNVQSIFCQEFIWDGVTGNPRFVGDATSILNVFGTLRLDSGMQFAFAGDVIFAANVAGATIDLGGQRLQRVAYFRDGSGDYTLAGAFAVDSLLAIQGGSLSTAGFPVETKYWHLQMGTPGQLDISGSVITVTGKAFFDPIRFSVEYPSAELQMANIGLTATGSIIDFTSTNAYLLLTGNPGMTLGTVKCSAPTGKSRVIVLNPASTTLTRLSLQNESNVEGNLQFDSLELGPGKTFRFQGGHTYTISSFLAMGTCAQPIQLFSTQPGVQAIFQAASGEIAGDYLSMRDIQGTGGATFTARNSTNLGNTTGWTIEPKTNNALYWVGGSGNWNDPMHWALTSGGPGGACVPTAGDDVFFDASSFPTANRAVTLDLDNAYCRSMTWTGATGNPRLVGTAEQRLHIFGSLTLIPTMRWEIAGDVLFEGSQDNTITTSDQLFLRDVYIDGTGTWRLEDDWAIESDFYFQQGNFITQGNRMQLQLFYSRNVTPRRLELGSSLIVLQPNKVPYVSWNLQSEQLTLDAGTSTIEFRSYGNFSLEGLQPLQFHRVVWYGNTGFYANLQTGVNTIDSLVTTAGCFFTNRYSLGVWEIYPGFSYVLNTNDTLRVRDFVPYGDCSGLVNIESSQDDRTAYLAMLQPDTVSYFIVKDIHNTGPGTLLAENSIDLGNTTGWTIDTLASRTLYWVGGDGNWNDPANWSLTSGGPGGECVPTPVDDVFFDAQSFNGPGQTVNARDYNEHYCRNITWEGVTNQPTFLCWRLSVYGNFTFVEEMFSDLTTLNLASELPGNQVTSAGKYIAIIEVQGSGSWILQDSLNAFYMYLYNGTFDANDQFVRLEYFACYDNGDQQKLILGDSRWCITSSNPTYFAWYTSSPNFEIDPGNAQIEFKGEEVRIYDNFPLTYPNVLMSNSSGNTEIQTYQGTGTFAKLEIRNNGTILGAHVIDSLLFAPGKSYRLDATNTQTITAYFQVIGNNCNPIELSSTSVGVPSKVVMNSGEVRGDFIQMRDQLGEGSVTFYAGVHSTDIGNSNRGWVFDSPEIYVDEGFLGVDIVLCRNQDQELDARTFSPGETYRWQDGSTDPLFTVTQPGLYWAEVSFSDNCQIRDSIRVLPPEDFTAALPADTTLCTGDTLTLDAGLSLVGLRYVWQDSSTASTFQVTAPGQYRVAVELSGCYSVDSIAIDYQAIPVVDLGTDQTRCPEDIVTLDATTTNGSYLWQDGSTAPQLIVNTSGLYSVGVQVGFCTGYDSIQIDYRAPLGLELGPDSTVCENVTVTLTPGIANADLRWQDGSVNTSFQVTIPGVYVVTATRDGCSETDSIRINHNPLPRFELGGDMAACAGDSLILGDSIMIAGASFQWEGGPTTTRYVVRNSGLYTLEASLAGCLFRDSLQVDFNPLPVLELGPDQAPCENDPVALDATSTGATYQWNTGSTAAILNVSSSGLYTVMSTLNGCTVEDSVRITFQPRPVFALGPDQRVCTGETVTLNGTAPGASYVWNTGSNDPVLTVTTTGLYWLEADLNGCQRRDSVQIEFKPLPVLNLGADQTPCEGDPVALDATSSGATYLWNTGSTSAVLNVSSSGLYAVMATLEGCTVQDSVQVTFQPRPVFALGADQSVCLGETVTLDGTAPGATYLWNTGSTTPVLSVTNTGLYWLEADLNGCRRRDSVQVTFIDIPVGFLGADRDVCQGTPVQLSPGISGATYRWQDGSQAAIYTVSASGVYTVQVQVGTCAKSDTVGVNFRPAPVFNLGKDTTLCAGEQLPLTINASADSYLWQDGSTAATFTARQTGLVIAFADLAGCSWRDSLRVTVREPLRLNLGADTTICDDQTLRLQANVRADSYRWQDGSQGPLYEVTAPGMYTVTAADGRCLTSDSIQVMVRRCIVYKVYAPNAFSPNGDGINDEFRLFVNPGVVIQTYEMRIFDRWGNMVFSTRDPETAWDGTWKGQQAAMGTYIFSLYIQYQDDRRVGQETLGGEVQLLR
ncbi:MAG: gliding motility-associated C-terminal domain-containing protein [Lewinellaceae bacterium]|nr:gliding motility-associated C-terminal domain-containing protein [Lewinellaceae bacterium]